jgi:hypothetical protein
MKLPFEINAGQTINDTHNYMLAVYLFMLKWVFVIWFLIILQSFIAILWGNTLQNSLTLFACPFAIFGLLWLLIRYINTKNFTKNQRQFETIRFTFTEKEVIQKAEGLEIKLEWSNYTKVRKFLNLVLLFKGRMPINAIPKRYFKTNDDINSFVKMVNRKIKASV